MLLADLGCPPHFQRVGACPIPSVRRTPAYACEGFNPERLTSAFWTHASPESVATWSCGQGRHDLLQQEGEAHQRTRPATQGGAVAPPEMERSPADSHPGRAASRRGRDTATTHTCLTNAGLHTNLVCVDHLDYIPILLYLCASAISNALAAPTVLPTDPVGRLQRGDG